MPPFTIDAAPPDISLAMIITRHLFTPLRRRFIAIADIDAFHIIALLRCHYADDSRH